MITPKQIEEKTMSIEKRNEAKNSIWGFYIGRPLTYLLTIPFLYTNITPNTVTYLSIICVLISYFFMSCATNISMGLWGLFFLFLWSMGDGIDGNIARYKNIKSNNGDLLDTLGGYMAMCIVYLGMGNMAYHDVNAHFFFERGIVIELAGISAVAVLIPRVLMHRKIAREKENSKAELLRKKESYSFLKIIMLNITDPAGFQEHIILLSIVFHLEVEFTILYCFFNVLIMVYSIRQLLE